MKPWQINRTGIINFWYYDDEEFRFEDGRMLLRGANGSGKSVTMQSFIPLLFDGNRSPERLDPFGSRARKMDSYLLSDGLDLEERTGYLFMEFSKPDSDRYMTIGMGLRARKNTTLNTWYFILLDNRRIGAAYDLSLYKDIGDRIPLTEKELANRIGDGGRVFSRQRDYKEAVNDHLFGYEDLADFDELIELLIQIRSPKLSKEFKPTTMYEIMQNSLVTLTEEDLRPMSEAIENMDEIRVKIDALTEAKKAMGRIDSAYAKYNQHVLATKARKFLELSEELAGCEKEQRELAARAESSRRQLEETEQAIGAGKEEQRQLEDKKRRLQAHDLARLAEERIQLEKSSTGLDSEIGQKEKHLERGRSEEAALRERLKRNEDARYLLEKEIAGILEEMGEVAEACGYDEDAFLKTEYGSKGEEPFNFDYYSRNVQKYRGKLDAGLQLIREQAQVQKAYDKAMEKRDDASRKAEHQRQKLNVAEKLLADIKEEFAQKVFAWQKDHPQPDIGRQSLQKAVEMADRFMDPYRFDQILEPVKEAYERERQRVLDTLGAYNGQRRNLEDAIREKEAAWQALSDQKEPEPQRTAAVLRNRQRLAEAGIRHLPLYKAIDFVKDTEEGLKGRIEEALLDLGLLDALVIAPEDRERALAMDEGMADKYIFADPVLLSWNLGAYLQPDSAEQVLDPAGIVDVIESMLVSPADKSLFIDEKGHYGVGILRGKSSGTLPSRFIGYLSRKRYKESLLADIRHAIDGIREQVRLLDEAIGGEQARLAAYKEAWDRFPGQQDLQTAYEEARHEKQYLAVLQKTLQALTEECENLHGQLQDVGARRIEATRQISLPARADAYEEALTALDAYREALQRCQISDRELVHKREEARSLEAQLAMNDQQQDDIRYDLNKLEDQRKGVMHKLHHITEELKLSDYEKVLADLAACTRRLEALPGQLQQLMEAGAELRAAVSQLAETEGKLGERHQRIAGHLALFRWAFEEEWKLGYLAAGSEEEVPADTGAEVRARQVLELYGDIFDEGKNVVEYVGSLNEKFHREQGELVEYNLKIVSLFSDIPFDAVSEDDRLHIQRSDIEGRIQGKTVRFREMQQLVERQIREQSSLLEERDRQLFEETLINTVGRQISSKIYHSEKWVKKIDELMVGMDTSMGLTFNLRWTTRKAEAEEQLSTEDLVGILKGDPSLISREKKDRLIAHFKSKINQVRLRMEDEQEQRSHLAIMKEVLDYRKWFEFQLYYTKAGDRKKELTNNAFFTFSGGEKAMAMYVPLFSSVYAKYQGGRADCPKVISLDEAFAGVDEENIQDMFRLVVELDLNFVANSQILFGDYETVPSLAVYELIRPKNATYVTLVHYKWNGKVRSLVVNADG